MKNDSNEVTAKETLIRWAVGMPVIALVMWVWGVLFKAFAVTFPMLTP